MKDEIKNKLTHGVPNLTDAECLWLWQQAFPGEAIERRKRCKECDGEGYLEDDVLRDGLTVVTRTTCDACGGSGYASTQSHMGIGPCCSECRGVGYVEQQRGSEPMYVMCPRCGPGRAQRYRWYFGSPEK